MNSVVIPDSLLRLPFPWCLTSRRKREEQIQILPSTSEEIKTALDLLELSLKLFSDLPRPKEESLPKDFHDYWSFYTEWIAEKIPTVDEFNISCSEELLTEENLESLSAQMIEDVANYWIWTTTWDLVDTSSRWLEKILKTHEDSTAISRFLDIANRYWPINDRVLAVNLIVSSTRIAWTDAIPLLESVEKIATDPYLQELAQSYRNLVLNNPTHRSK